MVLKIFGIYEVDRTGIECTNTNTSNDSRMIDFYAGSFVRCSKVRLGLGLLAQLVALHLGLRKKGL